MLAGTVLLESPKKDIWRNDIWAMKIDSQGNSLWQRRYGGAENDGAGVLIRMRKGFVIVGGTNSIGSGGALVLRLDANGNIEPSCSFQKHFKLNVSTTSAVSAAGDLSLTKHNQVPYVNITSSVTTPNTTTTNICPP